MSALSLTSENFQRLIQKLMPRGPIWPREPDSVQAQIAGALAPTYERNTSAANNLLVDSFPATAFNLLPEWENTLGLPDPCAGQYPLISERQSQVVGRLVSRGGNMSILYYVSFAATLGYEITIKTFSPFRAGRSAAGDLCCDNRWSNAWLVKAPQFTIKYFSASGAAGDPLASWGSTALQCELQRLSPAHTILMFNYSGASDVSD